MTEKKLYSLLYLWQSRLGLSQWKISLVIEPCEDETSYMEVERSVDYQRAKIRVNPWMIDRTKKVPEDVLQEINDNVVEESLVHELLHICIRDLVIMIRNDLEGFLHRDVHELLKTNASRAEERFVDSLAVALCQSFRE